MKIKRHISEQDIIDTYSRLNYISKREFAVLIKLSKSRKSWVRFQVADILIDVQNQAGKKLLFKLACDRDEVVRTSAYDSLSKFYCQDVERFLKKCIEKERDDLARGYAIMAWAEVVQELHKTYLQQIKFVEELLQKKKIYSSERALLKCYYALYCFGCEDVFEKIVQMLKSKNYQIRFSTFQTIIRLNREDKEEEIIEILKDMLRTEGSLGLRVAVMQKLKGLICDEENENR